MASIEQLKAKRKKEAAKAAAHKKNAELLDRKIRIAQDKKAQKRTFEKGRIVEKIQAAVNGLRIVAHAPRVAKKDDPAGYERYRAYIAYQALLAEKSAATTPENTEKWLMDTIKRAAMASHDRALSKALANALVKLDDGHYKLDWSSEDYTKIAKWRDSLDNDNTY